MKQSRLSGIQRSAFAAFLRRVCFRQRLNFSCGTLHAHNQAYPQALNGPHHGRLPKELQIMAVFLGVGVVSDPFGQTLDRCTHDHHKTRNHARFASLNNGQAEDQHIIATCSVDSGLNTGKSAKVRSPAKLGLDRVLLPS